MRGPPQDVIGELEHYLRARREQKVSTISATPLNSDQRQGAEEPTAHGLSLQFLGPAGHLQNSYPIRLPSPGSRCSAQLCRELLEDGQSKLVFDPDPSRRWILLKLLDDDYLNSVMTHLRYEVNSKIARVAPRTDQPTVLRKTVRLRIILSLAAMTALDRQLFWEQLQLCFTKP